MRLSGSPADYLLVFLGGITLSFSPCVYPLIPITAGYVAVNAAGSKLKGLILSFIYVTGIAITYALLGLVAVLTGRLFGSISSHPVTFILAGIIIIIFGLSLFDAFPLTFAAKINLARFPRKGYFSVLVLGLVSGLVISPCVAPALGAILVYLATTKNILYGATLLMTFAYGMGLILILVGTSSAVVSYLPQSGKWMERIKKAAALMLIGAGIYFACIGIRRF
jgi:cytochrome c-type biogenesis protein